MNSVEDRLRAAARAAASTVADGSAPKLKVPKVRHRAHARPRRFVTWAAPLAAAIAVAAVVIATAVLRGTALGPGPASQAPAALPRYFVALTYAGPLTSPKTLRTVAIVGNTATGRPISTITPPKPYDAFVRVTADASGTRYVVAAEVTTRGTPPKAGLYELRIMSKGSRITAAMSPVLGPSAFSAGDDIALSPDGTRLAVTHGHLFDPGKLSVRVYDLATGAARTWVLPGRLASIPAIQFPSWEANGRYLALDVSSYGPAGRSCLDCIRLLDTAASGGSILADSRLLVRSPGLDSFANWTAALITPDGRRVLRSAIVPVARNSDSDRPWVYAYNARSGVLIRSMTGNRGIRWTVLWSSPDGRSFVISSVRQSGRLRFVTALRFADGRWHPVPVPPQTFFVAW